MTVKKLKRNNGESLTEALVSMLVISLGLLILVGAIVSSGRANSVAGEEDARLFVNRTIAASAPEDSTVSFYIGTDTSGTADATIDVEVYSTTGEASDLEGLKYYEKK